MAVRLLVLGDLMTGRGIDQILPHPGSPILHESYTRDAREYVTLARETNGVPIIPVNFKYIWGDSLPELTQSSTDVRIANLETSITSCDDFWLDKQVHYRMHPQNVGCLSAGQIDCCCLANNHVVDWGNKGLKETLQTLDRAGIRHAGAGSSASEAASPASIRTAENRHVYVFSYGSTTSGIPVDWAATTNRPGVNLLSDLSVRTAEAVASQMGPFRQPGDLIVASIHWGGNWGHEIPQEQIDFAHRLIEQGVDLVHGHSSHHIKAAEIYQGRLILYGCGDFVNDYEGVQGFEEFRGDLAAMYRVTIDSERGQLLEARLIPMQIKQFRLRHVSAVGAAWLGRVLNRWGKPLNTQMRLEPDLSLTIHPR